jgi:hypothetical protein
MFNKPEQIESFIDHIKHLLGLTDVSRSRRRDWKELKRLLEAAGYWKRRYLITKTSTRIANLYSEDDKQPYNVITAAEKLVKERIKELEDEARAHKEEWEANRDNY